MRFGWEHVPRVIGHRGSPRDARENTMDSFRAAIAAGVEAVELDARLTADDRVVVHHDGILGRVFPGDAAIEESASDTLLKLGIPLLRDVLALPDVLVNVEIKADASNASELPARVLAEVQTAGALERVLVSSFDPDLADHYARLSRRPAGAILPFAPGPDDLASWPRLSYVSLVDDACEQEVVDMVRSHGRKLLVWTVNEVARAQALLSSGADGIITDRPGALRAALR